MRLSATVWGILIGVLFVALGTAYIGAAINVRRAEESLRETEADLLEERDLLVAEQLNGTVLREEVDRLLAERVSLRQAVERLERTAPQAAPQSAVEVLAPPVALVCPPTPAPPALEDSSSGGPLLAPVLPQVELKMGMAQVEMLTGPGNYVLIGELTLDQRVGDGEWFRLQTVPFERSVGSYAHAPPPPPPPRYRAGLAFGTVNGWQAWGLSGGYSFGWRALRGELGGFFLAGQGEYAAAVTLSARW